MGLIIYYCSGDSHWISTVNKTDPAFVFRKHNVAETAGK